MYEDLFGNVNQQFTEVLGPARRFNLLLLEGAEKLADLNLKSARAYGDLALQQWRAATEVADMESLRSYLSEQGKVVETVSQRLTEDANRLVNISRDFSTELQKLAQDNVTLFRRNAEKASANAASAASATASAKSGSTRKSA